MTKETDYSKINFNRCYHEKDTKHVYFFDHLKFKDALLLRKKSWNEDPANKYKIKKTLTSICEDLASDIEDLESGINVSAKMIEKYSYTTRTRQAPVKLAICKKLGEILCGDEYAFLHMFKCVEANDKIKEIYRMLYEILFMYDTTNCYNDIPEGEKGLVERYFENAVDEITKKINIEFLGEDKELKNKLLQITNEVKVFVKRFEVPGVVDRWLEVNPNLKFYDPVFDIMMNDKSLFEKIRNKEMGGIHFRFIPTEEEILARNNYFSEIQDKKEQYNFNFSDATFFKEELLNCLTKLFGDVC